LLDRSVPSSLTSHVHLLGCFDDPLTAVSLWCRRASLRFACGAGRPSFQEILPALLAMRKHIGGATPPLRPYVPHASSEPEGVQLPQVMSPGK
jgi:hypothetical protein